MNGFELAARFSYITNSLRFCGPAESSQVFLDCITGSRNQEEVRSCIRRFEGLFPYLSAIAKKHGKDFLDPEVVESYWLGNSLLDSFTKEDMEKIIMHLMERGLPASIGERLIKKMPDGAFPHHNFNVYHVGVGRITGKVETTLSNMDNCRISPGIIIEVRPSVLLVKTHCLKARAKGLYLGAEEIKTITYLESFLPDVKKGDAVALHWGFACLKLSGEQQNRLLEYDQRLLSILSFG